MRNSEAVEGIESNEETPVAKAGIWCLIANVAPLQNYGHRDEQAYQLGTKHFAPNAKLYCFPGQWGDGYEKIKVIGQHRGSPRLVTMVLPSKRLTNWRAKVAYHPYVLQEMGEGWQREDAELTAKWLNLKEQTTVTQVAGFDTVAPALALHHAAYLGLPDEIDNALAEGGDINARDADDWTPLMTAVNYRKTVVACQLIERGTDVNARTKAGWTPLLVAVRAYNFENIRLLLERGADRHAHTNAGDTVASVFVRVQWYLSVPSREVLRQLLEIESTAIAPVKD